MKKLILQLPVIAAVLITFNGCGGGSEGDNGSTSLLTGTQVAVVETEKTLINFPSAVSSNIVGGKTLYLKTQAYHEDGSSSPYSLSSTSNLVSMADNGFISIHPSVTDSGKIDFTLNGEFGSESFSFDITKDLSAVSDQEGKVVTIASEVLQSQRLESIDIFNYNGEVHVLAWYDLKGRVAHFNLSTQTATEHAADPGRFNVLNGVLVNNRLYKASNDPGYFGYFDLSLNRWVSKGRFGIPTSGDKIARLTADSSGNIYLGTATRGTLIKYTAATDSLSASNTVVDATSWFVGANMAAMQLHSINVTGSNVNAYMVAAHGIPTGTSFPVTITSSGVGLDGSYIATAISTKSLSFTNINGVADGTYQTPGMRLRNTECKGCYRYVESIGTDDNWVYLSMRDASTDRWWLVIRSADMSNTTEKVCFEDAGLTATSVLRHTNLNNWVFKKSGSDFRLLQGNQCPSVAVSQSSTIPYYRTGRQGEVYNYLAQPNEESNLFNMDIDANGLYVSSDQAIGVAELKFRSSAGVGTYQSLKTNVELVPSVIKRYTSAGQGKMIATVGSYGDNAIVDLNKKETSVIGRIASQSTYDVVLMGNQYFFSGYPTSTYMFDATLPEGWTNSPSNTNIPCGDTNAPNPCLLVRDWGKYHLYGGVGIDGNYYVASKYERQDLYGGEISWVNPVTFEKTNYRDTVSKPEYDCYSPVDFIPVNNGKQFVYSTEMGSGISNGAACSTGNGKLFVFDTESKSIINSFMPVNVRAQGKLVELLNQNVMGLIKDAPSSGSFTLYSANPISGAVAWSHTYTGNLFPDTHEKNHQAVLGSDGDVYALIDRDIVRIDSNTGALSTVSSNFIPLGMSLSYLEREGNNICVAGDVQLRCISTTPR